MSGVFFRGNAPGYNWNGNCFLLANAATVYYPPGAAGWGSTFAGRPALLWNARVRREAGVGIGVNGFGFVIEGTTNIPVAVQACTNMATGAWTPLQTVTLSLGAFDYADPAWTNYPRRFYRVHTP